MISLGQIGKLEVNRKRFCYEVGVCNAKPRDDAASLFYFFRSRMGTRGMRPGLNQQPAQLLYCLKKLLARLLHQNSAEQDAE